MKNGPTGPFVFAKLMARIMCRHYPAVCISSSLW